MAGADLIAALPARQLTSLCLDDACFYPLALGQAQGQEMIEQLPELKSLVLRGSVREDGWRRPEVFMEAPLGCVVREALTALDFSGCARARLPLDLVIDHLPALRQFAAPQSNHFGMPELFLHPEHSTELARLSALQDVTQLQLEGPDANASLGCCGFPALRCLRWDGCSPAAAAARALTAAATLTSLSLCAPQGAGSLPLDLGALSALAHLSLESFGSPGTSLASLPPRLTALQLVRCGGLAESVSAAPPMLCHLAIEVRCAVPRVVLAWVLGLPCSAQRRCGATPLLWAAALPKSTPFATADAALPLDASMLN